jgi:signal transduction histidine kinase
MAIEKDLEKLDSFMDEAIVLCRALAVDLSPPLLSEIGLSTSLSALAKRMQTIHGLDVRVTADGEIPADEDGVCLLLYQAVSELLFNVVKHSGVKCAAVQVSHSGEKQVMIKVSDEGVGFDSVALNRVENAPTGLGLFGIQERIRHIGGQMEIKSTPGRGTRVTLRAFLKSPIKSMAAAANRAG